MARKHQCGQERKKMRITKDYSAVSIVDVGFWSLGAGTDVVGAGVGVAVDGVDCRRGAGGLSGAAVATDTAD